MTPNRTASIDADAENGLVKEHYDGWAQTGEIVGSQEVFDPPFSFSAAALSGSFVGLLAAAIARMKGFSGKQGWTSQFDHFG